MALSFYVRDVDDLTDFWNRVYIFNIIYEDDKNKK
jgi:hypothetical protein